MHLGGTFRPEKSDGPAARVVWRIGEVVCSKAGGCNTGGVGELVVVAGMSGAGRSTAAATFEDAGWFVIDNMPPELAGRVVDLVARPGGIESIALVVGRAGTELGGLDEAITDLRHAGTPVRVLYLDAADDVAGPPLRGHAPSASGRRRGRRGRHRGRTGAARASPPPRRRRGRHDRSQRAPVA